ncbi:MAG: hypothetical protein ACREBA_00995 [Nitrosotalea sp.]
MTRYAKCDVCKKDFQEGTGAELKFKMLGPALWKMGDICSTCMKEKILPLFSHLKWKQYDRDSKKFLEYQGVVQED